MLSSSSIIHLLTVVSLFIELPKSLSVAAIHGAVVIIQRCFSWPNAVLVNEDIVVSLDADANKAF